MRARWISAAAAVAAAVGLAGGPAARADCRMTVVAEIPVVVTPSRILIPSQINGRKVFFILDTGASSSLLFSSAAVRLKVPMRGVTTAAIGRMYGVGGELAPAIGVIDDLKLGSLSMPHAEILVAGEGREGDDIVGLIGYDVLARHDIEFDLAHNMVRLLKTPGCSDDQMDYWRAPYAVAALEPPLRDNAPSVVDVRLGGAPIEALLDTGAPISSVTPVGAARAGVRIGSPGVVEIGLGGGLSGRLTPIWAARFTSFQIGEEKIDNPTLMITDLSSRSSTPETGTLLPTDIDMPQMLIGLDFFRAHRAIISRDHGKLYFSYNGGPIFEPPRKVEASPVSAAPAPAAAPPATPQR